MDKVKAEINGKGLSAECPYCAAVDGYVSTGEHSEHGTGTVRCSVCGMMFCIKW